MTKYKAVIITSKGSEQDLEDKINQILEEYASQGWKLHSQNCWYGEYGDRKHILTSDWFKCTLVFEKESK